MNTNTDNMLDCIIIGAGPAGLLCKELIEQGVNEVVYLEQASDFGRVFGKTWVSLRNTTRWVAPLLRGVYAADICTHRSMGCLPCDYGTTLSKAIDRAELSQNALELDQFTKEVENPQTVSGVTPDIKAFQQVLLKANGTVTAMLEAHFSEQIKLIKLSGERAKKELNFPNIKLDKEEEFIGREVLIQENISGRNYLYADSFILINNLE